MPRDASGNMTLPATNPVVADTDITTTWANGTLADLAAEVEDSLSRSGKGGMLVPFQNFDGTVTFPGISFTNDTTTGFSRSAAGLAVSIAENRVARWTEDGLSLVSGAVQSEVVDSGTAVGFALNTDSALSTTGAKLLSLANAGTEKCSVDKDGEVSVASGYSTGSGHLTSGVANDASAVGFSLNTAVSLSTTGAKLLSLQNNGVEKFAIDKDGIITVGLPQPNYTISSGSTGTFNTQSASLVEVTNATATITAAGSRPVEVSLIPDGSANNCSFRAAVDGGDYGSYVVYRGTTVVAQGIINTVSGVGSSLLAVDVPDAGAHTYSIKVVTQTSTTTIYCEYMKLYAKEI